MPTSYNFDKHTLNRLNKLKEKTGASSKTEVIRKAIALLFVATKEKDSTIIIKSPSGEKKIVVI